MAPWLLQLIGIGSDLKLSWNFPINVLIQRASFTACVCTKYLASVLDNTMICCFFELHVTAWPIWNEYPNMECQSTCPPQSTSLYTSTILLLQPPQVSQWCFMAKRYNITHFTPSQWASPGFWMNWDSMLIANAASGWDTITGHSILPMASL